MSLAEGTALAVGLALSSGCDDGPARPAVSSLEPASSISVSDSAPGVAANLTFESAIPAGGELIGSQLVHLPGGWRLNDAPNGDIVGAGLLELDSGCDGAPDRFNFELVRQPPPDAAERTAWRASIPGFMDLLFRVEAPTAGGYDISVTFPWDFFPEVVACAPGSFNFTVEGASRSGAPVLTNPSPDGGYFFSVIHNAQSREQLSVSQECVPIGTGVCPTTGG